MPKHNIKMMAFDAFEKHECDAKLALNIILSLLTPNLQTNSLSDKDIIDLFCKIF